MSELKLKRCLKCNNLIKVMKDMNDNIICCGEKMEEVIPNQNKEILEKHLPYYEKKEDKLIITVKHVMEEEHYIEWLMFKGQKISIEKFLNPNEEAELEVPYEKGAYLYSYCNKHGLWMNKVD